MRPVSLIISRAAVIASPTGFCPVIKKASMPSPINLLTKPAFLWMIPVSSPKKKFKKLHHFTGGPCGGKPRKIADVQENNTYPAGIAGQKRLTVHFNELVKDPLVDVVSEDLLHLSSHFFFDEIPVWIDRDRDDGRGGETGEKDGNSTRTRTG